MSFRIDSKCKGSNLAAAIQRTSEDMPQDQTALDILRALLAGQQLAAVATQMHKGPYVSLVAFSASDDLREITFVTSRTTTKYRNVSANPNVSILIDSRTHSAEDFSTGAAVTAVGKASEITGSVARATTALFIAKHPYLEAFVKAPTTAILNVCIEKYYVVTRFQNVAELDAKQLCPSV